MRGVMSVVGPVDYVPADTTSSGILTMTFMLGDSVQTFPALSMPEVPLWRIM